MIKMIEKVGELMFEWFYDCNDDDLYNNFVQAFEDKRDGFTTYINDLKHDLEKMFTHKNLSVKVFVAGNENTTKTQLKQGQIGVLIYPDGPHHINYDLIEGDDTNEQ